MSLANRNSLEPWMPDTIQYYQHQVEGIRQMAEMRSVILADEMGLGKTLQALTVFTIDIKRRYTVTGGASVYGETLLVVCPASLKPNWLEETAKFTHIHSEVLTGPKPNRVKQLDKFAARTGPRILIINYEQLSTHFEKIDLMRFHMVIFDEAHRMKNVKTKTSKTSLALSATRSLLLTGSPLLNQVNELWPLLERSTPGEWGSYYKFVQRYCVYGGYGGKQIVAAKNVQELKNRLTAVMIRRLKKDVLDLPEVQHIQRITQLSHRQKLLYKQVVEEMRLEVASGMKIDIANAMTKVLRLKQISATTLTVIDEDSSDKLDLAAEDARTILESGQKVVAFTQFRAVLSGYKKRMEYSNPMLPTKVPPIFVIHGDVPVMSDGRAPDDPKKRFSRQEIVHRWAESSEPGILIAMFQVAAVGLNMTAARHVQLLDKLYVPKLNEQAIDRCHRIGADKSQPVQVYEYLNKDTVEYRTETILKRKSKLFDNTIEADSFTKKLIKEILKEEGIQ